MPDAHARGLLALGLVLAISHAARPAISYRALDFGGSTVDVGVLASAYALLPFVLALPLGAAIDRRGPSGFTVGGCALLVAPLLLAWQASGVALLLVAQALLGLGHVLVALSVQTRAALEPIGAPRVRAFAHVAVATSVGHLLGPVVLAGAIAPEAGAGRTDPVFLACAGMAVVATVVSTTRRAAAPAHGLRYARAGGRSQVRPTMIFALATRPGMLTSLGAGMAVVMAVDLLLIYLPVLGEHRGLEPAVVAAMLALRAGSALVSRLALPRLARRWQRERLLPASLAVAALALIAIVTVPAPWVLALALCAAGLALGLGNPLTSAWVADLAHARQRTTALSLKMTTNRLTQLAAPPALGVLAAAMGPTATLGAGAVALGAASMRVTAKAVGPEHPNVGAASDRSD